MTEKVQRYYSKRRNELIILDLHISTEEYLKLYEGRAFNISARSIDGRRVQFPANIMREHLRHDGITGRFALEIDLNYKLVGLHRL
ncbi:MAG: hypothetical protein ACI93R_002920 [Flavobacteriales bacterium]|jgi:hypothetical protein